jgi:hypothetical protein
MKSLLRGTYITANVNKSIAGPAQNIATFIPTKGIDEASGSPLKNGIVPKPAVPPENPKPIAIVIGAISTGFINEPIYAHLFCPLACNQFADINVNALAQNVINDI